jgi:diketogulonate reductase-like aldo/keto reductase
MSKAKIHKIFENEEAKRLFKRALKDSNGFSAFDLNSLYITEEMVKKWYDNFNSNKDGNY